MANRYSPDRHQKRSEGSPLPPPFVDRDGILLGEEFLDGLYLNAHPVHYAEEECDYEHETGSVRDQNGKGWGRG